MGKAPEPGHAVRVNPAIVDQTVREGGGIAVRRIVVPAQDVAPEPPGGQVHFPDALGSQVKSGLEPPELIRLVLLGFFELGYIRRGNHHHGLIAVVLDPRSPNLPPEPGLSLAAVDPVGVLHHLFLLKSIPQHEQNGGKVVRVDQVGQRFWQREALAVTPDEPAEAGADIDDPRDLPHLQQCHAALHVLQQGAEGDDAGGSQFPVLLHLLVL